MGQARRLAQRRDAKHCSRAAVQDDPVIHTLGGEEIMPTLLAHACNGRSVSKHSSCVLICAQCCDECLDIRLDRRMHLYPHGIQVLDNGLSVEEIRDR
jgi:hypothetical protein